MKEKKKKTIRKDGDVNGRQEIKEGEIYGRGKHLRIRKMQTRIEMEIGKKAILKRGIMRCSKKEIKKRRKEKRNKDGQKERNKEGNKDIKKSFRKDCERY